MKMRVFKGSEVALAYLVRVQLSFHNSAKEERGNECKSLIHSYDLCKVPDWIQCSSEPNTQHSERQNCLEKSIEISVFPINMYLQLFYTTLYAVQYESIKAF